MFVRQNKKENWKSDGDRSNKVECGEIVVLMRIIIITSKLFSTQYLN